MDKLRRDLDILVAVERGYHVERMDGHWLLVTPGGGAYVEADSEAAAWDYVPNYTANEAYSLDLIMALYEQSDTIDFRLMVRPGSFRLRCDFERVHIDVTARTLPQARVQAYLSYVRQTKYPRI